MTPLVMMSIQAIPRVLMLVVGVLGFVFSIKGRARGVSGLMTGAFVVMLVTTAAGIAWQFISLDAPSWVRSSHLSVDELNVIFLAVAIPLDVAAVLSWLLVAIGVVKSGRPRPGFAPYPGPAGYPVAPQPGYPQYPPN